MQDLISAISGLFNVNMTKSRTSYFVLRISYILLRILHYLRITSYQLRATSVSILLLSIMLVGCETDLSKVEKIASNEVSLPVETSREVELIYSDSSIVRAKLLTPVLKFYKVANAYHEMPAGVFVEFYGPNNVIESTLSAKYGRKFENQGIIEVKDSVVVINNKGERLDTERLIWNEKTKKIYTNSFVRITTKTDVMFGEGMEANQNFTNYRIYKYRGSVSLDETKQ